MEYLLVQNDFEDQFTQYAQTIQYSGHTLF